MHRQPLIDVSSLPLLSAFDERRFLLLTKNRTTKGYSRRCIELRRFEFSSGGVDVTWAIVRTLFPRESALCPENTI